MPYTILIAESQPLMALCEKDVLSNLTDVHLIETCISYEYLVAFFNANVVPDIIILDPTLGSFEGIALFKKVKYLSPKSRTLIFGSDEDPVILKKYFNEGVKGYLSRKATAEDLINAVTTIQQNGIFLDYHLEKRLSENILGIKKKCKTRLTKRECEILSLIVEEHTNREIAQKLFVELCTVESHRQNLLQKLGVKNTAGLVRVALQKRLYQFEFT